MYLNIIQDIWDDDEREIDLIEWEKNCNFYSVLF